MFPFRHTMDKLKLVFGFGTNNNPTNSAASSSPESIDDDIEDINISLDDNISLVAESSMEEEEQVQVARQEGDDDDVELKENEENISTKNIAYPSTSAGCSKNFNDWFRIRLEDQQQVPEPEGMVEEAIPEDVNMCRFGSSCADPHPLLVPNIVRDILNYLPLTDVVKSRAVCQAWNEEACLIIQKKSMITFVDNATITNYLKYYPSFPNPEAGAAGGEEENSQPPPSSLVQRPAHLSYQMYKLDFAETNTVVQNFLAAHGEHIQTLILQQCPAIVEKELYWALENYLPNLETLWLRNVPLSPPVPTNPRRVKDAKPRCGPSPVELRDSYHFPSIKHFTIGTRSFMTPNIDDVAARFGGAGDPAGMFPPGAGAIFGDGADDDLFEIPPNPPPPPRTEDNRAKNSMIRLLSSCPNLQTFTVSILDHACDSTISSNILKALIEVPPSKLSHLSQIKFPLHVNKTLLTGLNQLHLANLNEVNLSVDKETGVGPIKEFLLTVGPNLRKLNLVFPIDFPYTNCIRLPGHEMRKMKDLTLNRYRWSLDFIENITGLESLICTDMTLPIIFPIYIKHEHNLKILKIHGKDSAIKDSEVLSRITRAFPRLEVLHIPGVTDDCLRVIYTDLPFLTELACVDGEFTDCGTSGVSLEVCNDLAETMTYLFVNPDKFRRDLFIGNLTNLTHLRLESPNMSHLSVLFGIVKCTRVENLYLKSDQILDNAVESIADQMMYSLKELNVTNCPGVTEAGKFFARERIPHLKAFIPGDKVEDHEKSEHLKAQAKHQHFDAFSRRRARDRPESPRSFELHRRRLVYRLAHHYDLLNEPLVGAAGAAGPAHPPNIAEEVFGPADHFLELQHLQLQHEVEPGEGGLLGADYINEQLRIQNILDNMTDDDTDEDEELLDIP